MPSFFIIVAVFASVLAISSASPTKRDGQHRTNPNKGCTPNFAGRAVSIVNERSEWRMFGHQLRAVPLDIVSKAPTGLAVADFILEPNFDSIENFIIKPVAQQDSVVTVFTRGQLGVDKLSANQNDENISFAIECRSCSNTLSDDKRKVASGCHIISNTWQGRQCVQRSGQAWWSARCDVSAREQLFDFYTQAQSFGETAADNDEEEEDDW